MSNLKNQLFSPAHSLQFITQDLQYISHWQQAKQACEAGIRWVQLRVKNQTEKQWIATAKKAKAVVKQFKHTQFIINDSISVAMAVEADGVHLGKNDISIKKARQQLPKHFIIGGTANTFEDVDYLNKQQVNYVGLGPFRHTSSKKNLNSILGVSGIKAIMQKSKLSNINLPIFAIGGIQPYDVQELIKLGIFGIAVSSAINNAKDKKIVTNHFFEQLITK